MKSQAPFYMSITGHYVTASPKDIYMAGMCALDCQAISQGTTRRPPPATPRWKILVSWTIPSFHSTSMLQCPYCFVVSTHKHFNGLPSGVQIMDVQHSLCNCGAQKRQSLKYLSDSIGSTTAEPWSRSLLWRLSTSLSWLCISLTARMVCRYCSKFALSALRTACTANRHRKFAKVRQLGIQAGQRAIFSQLYLQEGWLDTHLRRDHHVHPPRHLPSWSFLWWLKIFWPSSVDPAQPQTFQVHYIVSFLQAGSKDTAWDRADS